MIQNNEYDIIFSSSKVANVGLWPGNNFVFDFDCPATGNAAFGLSGFLIAERSIADLNGHKVELKHEQITACEHSFFHHDKGNKVKLNLSDSQSLFYNSLSVHAQFDRIDPVLPTNDKFKVLDLYNDLAFSELKKINGCSFFSFPQKHVVEADGIPFLKFPPKAIDHHIELPVNAKVDSIFFLGLTSSWDVGTVHINTRLGDHRFEQFIGDRLGEIIIEYADSTKAVIPLIFGITLWWDRCWYDLQRDRPCQEPFLSNERSRKILEDTLLLSPAVPGGDTSFYFSYKPEQKVIKSIRIDKNGTKHGYPLVSGITFATSQVNENIRPAPSIFITTPRKVRCEDNSFFEKKKFDENLEALKRQVYTYKDTLPANPVVSVPEDHSEAHTTFEGSSLASMLSNAYYQNLHAIKKLQIKDGSFNCGDRYFGVLPDHTAIGTWAKRFENPADQAAPYGYSRDAGAALIELIKLNMMDRSMSSASRFKANLYKVSPPHWLENGFIFDHKEKFTFKSLTGKSFQGLTESNGHNWLTRAYYVLWHQMTDNKLWEKKFWKTFCDAVEWNCWLMDNPLHPDQPKDIIPEGGELAGENSMIKYEVKSLTAMTEDMPPFRYDSIFANISAYYSLKCGIQIANSLNKAAQAKRWAKYSSRLKKAILKNLLIETSNGSIWRISMDALMENLYISTRLASLFLWFDTFSHSSSEMDEDMLEISRNSYKEHRRRWPNFCHCIHELGYGTAFSTLAALALDEVRDYSNYLRDLVSHLYFKPEGTLDNDGNTIIETFPYVAHMRRGVHESGRFWKTFGIPANTIHVSQILKVVRIIRGIDDGDLKILKIVPRLPDFITQIKINDFDAMIMDNDIKIKTKLSYSYLNQGGTGTFELKSTEEIPSIAIRLGPFEKEVQKVVVKTKSSVTKIKPFKSGDSFWCWFRPQGKIKEVQLSFESS